MIWSYHGTPIPLDVYHGVPKGWYREEILTEHARLGGTFNLCGADAVEPGAPSWMPERYSWLQYRQTLYRIADGVSANDSACIELAIRYIELRHIGSYSGYVRSLLSSRLKHAKLKVEQESRLRTHFLKLVAQGERTQEFRDYLKLWRTLCSEENLQDALTHLKRTQDGQAKAAWLAKHLQPNGPLDRTFSTVKKHSITTRTRKTRYVPPCQKEAKTVADECGDRYCKAIWNCANLKADLLFFSSFMDNDRIKDLERRITEAMVETLTAFKRLDQARLLFSENKRHSIFPNKE